MDEPIKRRTYDVPDAARVLGTGRNALYEAIKRGEVPAIRVGRRVLVPHAVVERMLAGEAKDAAA